MQFDYDDADFPVRDDLVACHRQAWRQLSETGTWLSGAERVKIMAEVRRARTCGHCREIKSALSPYTIDGNHDALGELPANWIDMIHRIVADPGRLTHSWYNRVLAGGIEEAQFVEIVSVIAHTTAIDTFARGLGVGARPLPAAQAGEPARYRPAEAKHRSAWVATLAADDHGPDEADLFEIYAPNIRLALTLVPDEARRFFELAGAQYLPLDELMMPMVPGRRSINRVQIELLAARVSALNQCTY